MISADLTGSAGDSPALLAPAKRGWYSRGYLPHRDDEGLIQFITFRLYDSMPAELLDVWKEELRSFPKTKADSELRSRILKYVDRGHGQCFLRIPAVANLVQSTLLRFHAERYELLEWVVMPNHVHVLIEPRLNWSLDGILHSWKSYTAKKANQLLGRRGTFWYREYYDRWIRNEEHYARVVEYIAGNPVKANLCAAAEEFPWCSSSYCVC
ncbi:MAG TPA: transposase [Fimbriimonadaceae bacterium]|nr:transposase [Fimbriimonadaceae bacterium]